MVVGEGRKVELQVKKWRKSGEEDEVTSPMKVAEH